MRFEKSTTRVGFSTKKRYLGVAILVHHNFLRHHDLPSLEVCCRELPCDDRNESRFLTLSIGDLSVSSVYVPYNVDRRIEWLRRLREHVRKERFHLRDAALCGDFNVKFKADGKQSPDYTQEHEDALKELMNLGFCDLYRTKYDDSKEKPGHTRGYSDEFPIGTSRLHLMLASKSLSQRLLSACVDVKSKPWPRKDAPPLIVDLDDT